MSNLTEKAGYKAACEWAEGFDKISAPGSSETVVLEGGRLVENRPRYNGAVSEDWWEFKGLQTRNGETKEITILVCVNDWNLLAFVNKVTPES